MIKALILAYDFPPYTSVGGQRPFNWYKHFKDFGIYPVVITRQWSIKYGNILDYISPGDSDFEITEDTEHGKIIRTPYHPNLANRLYLKHGENKNALLRKLVTAFYEFSEWVFTIGPKSGLYKGAKKYLKKNTVDIIIASGEPYVLFRYAYLLGEKYNIKWIADYRDAWVQDKTRFKNGIHAKYFSFMERKIVSKAIHVTTVSEFIKKQLSLNLINSTISVFPNGFDTEILKSIVPGEKRNNCLTISLAGTIYKWHPWKIFLLFVNDYIKETGRKICINFFGINIINEITEFKNKELPEIRDNIKFFPRLNNLDLLHELLESNILLLFNDYSISGTKIYDYLAVGRKILLCFSDDKNANLLKADHYCIEENDQFSKQLQEDIIKKTNSGIVIRNVKHLKEIFDDLFTEFEENNKIECNSIGIEEFSRKKQTEALAKLIKQIVNSEK
jgi:glycosyltransferase involved in cell wall biosynthesis